MTPDASEQVARFMDRLPQYPAQPTRAIIDAVDHVAEVGPAARRPILGEIVLLPDYPAEAALFGHRLRELRPLGTDVRVLCTFGPDQTLVLLHAGDKAGDWHHWYRKAIREAAAAYRVYLVDTGQ